MYVRCLKLRRNVTINTFYFKSCFYGFTQSIMLGIDLYNKNTFSAWHVSGYSTEWPKKCLKYLQTLLTKKSKVICSRLSLYSRRKKCIKDQFSLSYDVLVMTVRKFCLNTSQSARLIIYTVCLRVCLPVCLLQLSPLETTRVLIV